MHDSLVSVSPCIVHLAPAILVQPTLHTTNSTHKKVKPSKRRNHAHSSQEMVEQEVQDIARRWTRHASVNRRDSCGCHSDSKFCTWSTFIHSLRKVQCSQWRPECVTTIPQIGSFRKRLREIRLWSLWTLCIASAWPSVKSCSPCPPPFPTGREVKRFFHHTKESIRSQSVLLWPAMSCSAIFTSHEHLGHRIPFLFVHIDKLHVRIPVNQSLGRLPSQHRFWLCIAVEMAKSATDWRRAMQRITRTPARHH